MALVATWLAAGATAKECRCIQYPFGSAPSCVDVCAARLINTAPFSEIFSVLDLPIEAQDEILAEETISLDPDSLAEFLDPTQEAIRNGLAGADPDRSQKLLAAEN